MHSPVIRTASLLVLLYLSSACAFGTTPIKIVPTPFESIEGHVEQARQGDIVVHRFTDNRDEEKREFIGAKRNGYGMVLGHLGVVEGTTLPDLMTQFFTEALRDAGYRAVIEGTPDSETPSDFQPIATLEGGIEKFWLDMYMATWHLVEISVSLWNNSDEVLWEGLFEGEETNVLWLGLSGEFEKVIRQALDKALAQAVVDFSSDDFAEQLSFAAQEGNADPSETMVPPDPEGAAESDVGGL